MSSTTAATTKPRPLRRAVGAVVDPRRGFLRQLPHTAIAPIGTVAGGVDGGCVQVRDCIMVIRTGTGDHPMP
jgi:hypothetical protein